MSQTPASTLVKRGRAKLDAIVAGLAQLMTGVSVERRDENYDEIVVIAPKFYWSELNAEQRASQIVLLRQYRPTSEIIALSRRS